MAPMVLTSGAFDGLHAGHVRYLAAAKALCEKDELLVCAVAPDRYIQSTKHRAPRWPQAERMTTVRGLQDVDAVIGQAEPSIGTIIRTYSPRLFVKGPDWRDRLPEDVHEACTASGTAIAFVETEGRHVSETMTSDEEALAQFEGVVLGQQAPTAPWQPVTPFDYESRKVIEGPHVELIWTHLIPSGNADVLDFGCGPDGHLVRMLREVDSSRISDGTVTVEGYDPQAKESLRQQEPESRAIWDLVICREVLEHCPIREIRRLVTKLCALTTRYVYVTTRFAKAPTSLLTVDTQDGLDPTHISMLNQTFLRALFVLEGFKRRADLEQVMDWKKLGRVLVYERA